MSRTTSTVREVRGDETDFTTEARAIQRKALDGQTSIVRLGEILFFSTESGDAWMLDVNDGEAACLARDYEKWPIPILETETSFSVEWSASYAIRGELFIVVEPGGSSRAIAGYPIREIQRLIAGHPVEAGHGGPDASGAAERLKTRRNDPCPCGSGRKYKKCCLAKDEALAHPAAEARPREMARLPESIAAEARDEHQPHLPDAEPEDDAFAFQDEEEAMPDAAAIEKVNVLWSEFQALAQPTPKQMDRFLEDLLALAPEEMSWSDLLHELARKNHGDLPAVFRRIAGAIPHTKKAGMSFFYWAAAEEFDRRGHRHLLPEVAAAFQKLDGHNYDADALKHLEDYLLAAGFEAEALQLCEHFLPIMREDGGLMPHAAPELCGLVFELRVGAALRSEADAGRPAAEVARALCAGIEEEIHPEVAANAVAVITAGAGPRAWTREHFDLTAGDISTDADAWRAALRLIASLIGVAREAWQLEQAPPGCAFAGLQVLLVAVCRSMEKGGKRKKSGGNLLSYLTPAGIDNRVAATCRDVIGLNKPKARLLLDAHGILARFAARHLLISHAEADQTEKELARLRRVLER
ncbi:MAG: SEC-C domain-containing protein [Verrucomicrobiota bacterium]|nr:SEC-C domain-containing protein [Verrucomicrobiota bacterium]